MTHEEYLPERYKPKPEWQEKLELFFWLLALFGLLGIFVLMCLVSLLKLL